MKLDVLLSNLAAGCANSRPNEHSSLGQRDAEGAKSLFAALLSGLDDRNPAAARAAIVDGGADAPDGPDHRLDRKGQDGALAADLSSASPQSPQGFVTAPIYEMNGPLSYVIATRASDSADFESSAGDNAPSLVGESASTQAESGASTPCASSWPVFATSPAPFATASDRRGVDHPDRMSRSFVTKPQTEAEPSMRQQPIRSGAVSVRATPSRNAGISSTFDIDATTSGSLDLFAAADRNGAPVDDVQALPSPKAPSPYSVRGSDQRSSNDVAFTSFAAISRDRAASFEGAVSLSNSTGALYAAAVVPLEAPSAPTVTAKPPAQRMDSKATVSRTDEASSIQPSEQTISSSVDGSAPEARASSDGGGAQWSLDLMSASTATSPPPSPRSEARVATTAAGSVSSTTRPIGIGQRISKDAFEDFSSTSDPASRSGKDAVFSFDPHADASASRSAPVRRQALANDVSLAVSRIEAAATRAAEVSIARENSIEATATESVTAILEQPVTMTAQVSEAAPAITTGVDDHGPRAVHASFGASRTPVVAAPARDRSFVSGPTTRASTDLMPDCEDAALDRMAVAVASPEIAQSSGGEASPIDEASDRLPAVESRRTSRIGPGQAESIAGARAPEADFASQTDSPPAEAAPVDEISTSAASSQRIGTLAILAPLTQLPSALAELLAPQARSLTASASHAVSQRAAPATDMQRRSVAPKILTFALEPASLGAVTVTMKLARSGLDMRISVESTEALRRLDSTRDRLVEAMQSSGCVVDSCTIQIARSAEGANAQAGPDSGAAYAQSDGAGAGSEEQGVGRQGAGYDGRGADRRRGAGVEAGEATSNGEIRRGADRGGAVYL